MLALLDVFVVHAFLQARRDPHFDLVVILPPNYLPPAHQIPTFRIPSVATLAPSGRAWLVDGREIGSLKEHVVEAWTKAAKAKPFVKLDDMPPIADSNFVVSLGERPTFGRAITAMTLLAREGVCTSGVRHSIEQRGNDVYQIGRFRDARDRLVTCRGDMASDLYAPAEYHSPRP